MPARLLDGHASTRLTGVDLAEQRSALLRNVTGALDIARDFLNREMSLSISKRDVIHCRHSAGLEPAADFGDIEDTCLIHEVGVDGARTLLGVANGFDRRRGTYRVIASERQALPQVQIALGALRITR